MIMNPPPVGAARTFKPIVAVVLIASLIVASPGPWLAQAFAQGASGRARPRYDAVDARNATPGARASGPSIQPEIEPGLQLPSSEAILPLEPSALDGGAKIEEIQTGPVFAVQGVPTAATKSEPPAEHTGAATTKDILSREERAMRTSPDAGLEQGRITYDGGRLGVETGAGTGEPVAEVRQAQKREAASGLSGLSATLKRKPAAAETGVRLPEGPDHGAPAADWKTWAFRGSLAAAAAAAVITGRISAGLLPLALLSAGVVLFVIVPHELAHMVVLKRLGDTTAAKHGHYSLNPFHHIHPWHTVAMPILTLTASMGFSPVPLVLGRAKPVDADFNKLRDPQRDSFWASLAGPAVNAVLGGVFLAAASFFPAGRAFHFALSNLGKVSLAAAAFNLLVPLPNFDGGKILVRFLPKRLYDLWTSNPRLPASYQSTYRRLYEGPANLLSRLGIENQRQVNRLAWGLNAAVVGALYAASLAWIGTPVAFLMLACAYDYYCIREKMQNEEAVQSLIGILEDFTQDLAEAAERDETIQSVINQEEVEHVLKNALEDVIDRVVDSQGFDALTDEEKWLRFEQTYKEAAVAALHEKGMTKDSPETIRRALDSDYGKRLFSRLKEWTERYHVWEKWHSPKRKAKNREDAVGQEKEKTRSAGGSGAMLSVAALAFLGASLLGLPVHDSIAALGMGALLGTVQDVSPQGRAPKVKTFEEAIQDPDLKFDPKEQAFLLMHLKEMKLEDKPPVTGRVAELEKVLKNVVAPRGDINSVVLIGEAGVGKTAVPEKLAQAIALSDTQEEDGTFRLDQLSGRYLLKLNLARLLQQDNPAAALDALIAFLQRFNQKDKRTGNKVILFIDEIHQMFLNPKGPQMANLLKEPLRDGELTIIAATTKAEYKQYMEPDDAFRRRMIPVWIEESTVPETLRALQGAKAYYEGLYGVKIMPEALQAAAENSKYDQEVFLPGRAFKYLLLAAKESGFKGQRDRLSAAIKDKIEDLRYIMEQLREDLSTTELATENLKKDKPGTIELYNWAVDLSNEIAGLYRRRAAVPAGGTPVVTADMVREQISNETGVASGQLALGREPMDKYLSMEENLNKIVVGQPEPIHAVSEAVIANKAGLSNPDGPQAVYYFTGPTGSGKTYFVKELAKYLDMAMIRLDMSEYMHDHEVAKMTGAPPGYIGYDQGGQLTEKVRRHPYSVILLDEIEKAHPAVYMMLLQILAEGRLTDGQGRLVDFKNTIIIMTSNLGMDRVNAMVARHVEEYKALQEELRAAGADAAKRREAEGKLAALSEQLSRDLKAPTEKITQEEFLKFPPEFQARFSAPPIVFNRISHDMALNIVELELGKLEKIMARAGNELVWTKEAVRALTFEGFDILLGARPLNNAIKRLVTQPLARAMLEAAAKNGNRAVPSLIRLDASADGNIRILVETLPPKKVSKRDAGEGAEQGLFAKVLESVIRSVSGAASAEFSVQEIDAWVKAALAAQPQAPKNPENPISAVPAAPSELVQAATVAPPEAPAAPKTAFFGADVPLALGQGAQRFTASHYDPKKDKGVRQFKEALAEALEAKGYPEEIRDALLRTVADREKPFVGGLKLFVEQAKLMGKDDQLAPIQLAFSVDENSARVVVHRNAQAGEKEAAMLKTHFTGAALDAQGARVRAETLSVMGKDGRRIYFDLYRALSAIPGARLGYATGANATGGAGTDYWIELPKPPPAPPPAPEPPASAERTPAQAPPAQPASDAPSSGETAQAAPAQAGSGKIRHNDDLYGEIVAVFRPRTQWSQAHVVVSRFRSRADNEPIYGASASGLWHRWSYSDPAEARRLVASLEAEPDIAYIDVPTELRDLSTAPSSGEAASGETAQAPAAPAAGSPPSAPDSSAAPLALQTGDPRLAKIVAAWEGDDAKTIWFDFHIPDSHRSQFAFSVYEQLIEPSMRRLGLAFENYTVIDGATLRIQAQAASQDDAVSKALALAEENLVAQVILHPAARASLMSRVSASPAPAPEAAAAADPARQRISVHNKQIAAQNYNHLSEDQRRKISASDDGQLGNAQLMFVRFRVSALAAAQLTDILYPTAESLGLTLRNSWILDNDDRILQFAAPANRVPAFMADAAVALARLELVDAVFVHRDVLSLLKPETAAAPPALSPDDLRLAKIAAAQNRVAPDPRTQAPRPQGEARPEVARKIVLADSPPGGGAAIGAAMMVHFRDGATRDEMRAFSSRFEEALGTNPGMPDMAGPWMLLNYPDPAEGARMARFLESQPEVARIEVRRDVLDFIASDAASYAPPAGGRREAGRPARGEAAAKARDTLRQFLYGLLGQGDIRSPGVRMAAADALAAVSSEEDLETARNWINSGHVAAKYPEIAAAATILARRGGGQEDEARILRIAGRLSSDVFSGHQYNPVKRRLIHALAKLLQTRDPAQARGLIERYHASKGMPGIDSYNGHDGWEDVWRRFRIPMIEEALYLAIARSGDEGTKEFLMRDWNRSRLPALHEYLSRVDPGHLRRLYDDWLNSGPQSPEPAHADGWLTLYAVADYGAVEDQDRLLDLFNNGRVLGTTFTDSVEDKTAAAEIFSLMVRRLNNYDRLRDRMRTWLATNLGGVSNKQILIAVMAAGEGGKAEDLEPIERILRENPATVYNVHEMTQHEAAIAWAKIAVREGLLESYLTQREPAPVGQRQMARIMAMLTDTNPIVNKAALEAIRLYYGGERDTGVQR